MPVRTRPGRRPAVLLLLLALALALPGGAAAEGRRVALVVGIGAYHNAPVLTNPPNDARAIGQRLKTLGFEVDTVVDPDRSTLEQAVKRFGDHLQGAAVGLFFYAGHGLQVAGRNYLVPIDADINSERSLPFATIDIDLVLSQMESTVPVNLVFLDACRDNPFSRSLARSLGTRSASVGRGLAQVEAGDGTLIVYATQPGNVAEDGEGADSPFTTALIKRLAEPNLEIRQVLTRVRVDVKEATNGKQVPWDHSSLTQDFYFVGPTTVAITPAAITPAAPAAPAPAPVPVDPMAVELAFWDSIHNSTDPADFEEYLKQYPKGKFSGIAKRRVTALRAEAQPRHAAAPPPPPAAKPPPEPKTARTEPPADQEPPPPPRPAPVAGAFDITYQGMVTNQTVGQSAPMRFRLRGAGGQLQAFVHVGPPLAATGPLAGQFQNGTCWLRGLMNQGFTLEAAGTCTPTGFTGRYRALANGQEQDGVFQMRAVAP